MRRKTESIPYTYSRVSGFCAYCIYVYLAQKTDIYRCICSISDRLGFYAEIQIICWGSVSPVLPSTLLSQFFSFSLLTLFLVLLLFFSFCLLSSLSTFSLYFIFTTFDTVRPHTVLSPRYDMISPHSRFQFSYLLFHSSYPVSLLCSLSFLLLF